MQNLRENNEGVAGIVVAVMLIGLLFTFLSLVQVNWVPDWSEEREAEHIDSVANQFTQMRFAVDILSTVDQSGNKITAPITLGTQEIPLPFLRSDQSFGYIKISPDNYMLKITDKNPTLHEFPLGAFQYSSVNSNYLNVEFIYEGGGIITNQDTGNNMYIKPSYDVDYSSDVDITLDVTNFIETGGKTYTTGNSGIQIQLEYVQKNSNTISNVNTLAITTEYHSSWNNFFNDSLKNAGLDYGASKHFVIYSDADDLVVDFDDALSVDITLTEIEIDLQIGPGWSEV